MSDRDELGYLPSLPRDREIPIGCIGAGFIMADCHLVAYRDAGLNPIAIAARREEQARQVAQRHGIASVYASYQEMLDDQRIVVVDIAVPPDRQAEVIKEVVRHRQIRGILAQKPLGCSYQEARMIVDLCHAAGVTLCVNQNMRYDQSVRACKTLLERGELGEPVLATIDMRAIPHWASWQQRQGWVTCRIMSIHHLDTMRFWFGTPQRVYASFRSDPRTQFPHRDGIGLYILEYDSGMRCLICDDVWTGPARGSGCRDWDSLAGRRDRGVGQRNDRLAGISRASAQHNRLLNDPIRPLELTALATGLVSRRFFGTDGGTAGGAGNRWPTID